MSITLILAAAATPVADAHAEHRITEITVACVPAQAIVPPFNNTAEAMEQSRFAATAVMAERARAGGKPVRVCRTSAVAPQVSEIEGVDEVPVDPDYEPEPVATEEDSGA